MQGLPVTTQAATLPTYFQHPPSSLEQTDVVLLFPPPDWALETAMAWAAIGGMRFSIAGVGGPAGWFARVPPEERAGAVVLFSVAYSYPEPTPITSASIGEVRQALNAWGVTKVIVPNDPELPRYDQIASTTEANALIAAATGRAPSYERAAWVWTRVDRSMGAFTPTTAQFSHCTTGLSSKGTRASRIAVSCVLGTRH